MCLILEEQDPKVAEEDIIVYKLLKEGLISCIQNFKYYINKLMETKLGVNGEFVAADNYSMEVLNRKYGPNWKEKGEDKGLISIGQGFHSCESLDRANIMNDESTHEHEVWECTIPKGSLYYKDESGLLVSNKIIINKKVE